MNRHSKRDFKPKSEEKLTELSMGDKAIVDELCRTLARIYARVASEAQSVAPKLAKEHAA